jgi:hypothetical protein
LSKVEQSQEERKTAPISQPLKKSQAVYHKESGTPAPMKPAPAADSFFAFGKDDTMTLDSRRKQTPYKARWWRWWQIICSAASTKLGDGLGDLHDDMDDDLMTL